MATIEHLQNQIRRVSARLGDAAAEAQYLRAYGRTMQQDIADWQRQQGVLRTAATQTRGGGAVTPLTPSNGRAAAPAAPATPAAPVVLPKMIPWVLGGIVGWMLQNPDGSQEFIADPASPAAPGQQALPQAPAAPGLPQAPQTYQDPGGLLGGLGGIFNSVASLLAGIPAAAKGIGGMINTLFSAVSPFAPVIAAVALLYAISAVFRLRVRVG